MCPKRCQLQFETQLCYLRIGEEVGEVRVRLSLARIPQRVTKLGPELYTTIFVAGCLLVKERPEWCRYFTLLSHGHISYLLTGCLEADEAGHTTSEFP